MGTVTVQEYTTKYPLQLMGFEAGVCWGADVSEDMVNLKRGFECLKSGHLRVAEFPQVYLILEGYSARVIRELYTHIGGSPTRLQASTRYIDYANNGLETVIPSTVSADEDVELFNQAINKVQWTAAKLKERGIPNEDVANLLPLGMASKMIIRTNMRQLMDMSHQRMCSRAYGEFREMMNDIMQALREYSEEWSFVAGEYFKPKCEVCGFCEEKFTCGRQPTKKQLVSALKAAVGEEELTDENYKILKKHLDTFR